MHIAAFIGELQHYENFKPLYLSTGKWAISPFLSDQVTFIEVPRPAVLIPYNSQANAIQ